MSTQARKIGDIEITALSDGVLGTSFDVVLEVAQPEIERLSGKKSTDPVHIDVNAFLLRRGGQYALIDTGSGNTMGPTLGKLPENLRALGVGNLIAMLQIATLPAELTEKNLRLFAAEVMPFLRGDGTRAAARETAMAK